MISFQIVSKYLPGGESLKRQKPGVTRGDLVLSEDDLPMELAGWNRTRFVPAPSPEELPDGQYWWVHQWQFQKDGTVAIVSFDQLGESQWHELTWCYRNLDWTIEERTAFVESENGGPYVLVRLRRNPDEYAILVFSVFFEDGSWASAPDVNLSLMNRANLEAPELLDRLQMKFDPLIVSSGSGTAHTRALQCQCLVSGSDRFSSSEADFIVKLHLESRQQLRQRWLQHSQSKKQLRSQAFPQSPAEIQIQASY